jgi:hypothetical protein
MCEVSRTRVSRDFQVWLRTRNLDWVCWKIESRVFRIAVGGWRTRRGEKSSIPKWYRNCQNSSPKTRSAIGNWTEWGKSLGISDGTYRKETGSRMSERLNAQSMCQIGRVRVVDGNNSSRKNGFHSISRTQRICVSLSSTLRASRIRRRTRAKNENKQNTLYFCSINHESWVSLLSGRKWTLVSSVSGRQSCSGSARAFSGAAWSGSNDCVCFSK